MGTVARRHHEDRACDTSMSRLRDELGAGLPAEPVVGDDRIEEPGAQHAKRFARAGAGNHGAVLEGFSQPVLEQKRPSASSSTIIVLSRCSPGR